MKNRLNYKKHRFRYLALAFFIPFLGMILAMTVKSFKCSTYSHFSMLYGDMYHQYYPFFTVFRRTLRNSKSLFYTWDIGMGMDYLGIISYYLASPLNLLGALVPDQWVLHFFCMLAPVKLGFAGMFYAVMLKNLYERNDLSISVFGSFYALCAWALGYHWNVMWLDTFAVLPLVVLGAVRLLQDRKFILYTVALFFAIFTNYYIGLFVCIFIFLLFLCFQVCCWGGMHKFWSSLLRMAFYSALAIGMTAMLELPAISSLGGSQSFVNTYAADLAANSPTDGSISGILHGMKLITGNLGGGLEPTFIEGLPNLYCGVGTVFLAVLYMTSEKIPFKEKICGLCLLTFFCLSFLIPPLNYIWHGLHFPNMIPNRFSFLYSFVLLWMAYKAWLLRETFGFGKVILSAILTIALLSCSDKIFSPFTLDMGSLILDIPMFYLYNSLFLFGYVLVVLWPKIPKNPASGQKREPGFFKTVKKKSIETVFLTICIVELLAALSIFAYYFNGNSIQDYPYGGQDSVSVLQHMKDLEPPDTFFRSEVTYPQTLNDGSLNDYHGISAFTSAANVNVTNYIAALGYEAKDGMNRYIFKEGSPVSNLFLGIKYMIERQGENQRNPMFEEVYHSGNVHLLKNNAYLPLGFLTETGLLDLDFSKEGSRFQFQNELLSAASGLKHPVWHILPDAYRNIQAENVTAAGGAQHGEIVYGNAGEYATITYRFTADQSGFLCFHMAPSKKHLIEVRMNGELQYKDEIRLPQIQVIGNAEPGDQAEIIVSIEQDDTGILNAEAAILDENAFLESYEILKKSTLGITCFRPTYLEGSISCSRDGLLYTSIPQNGCWHVTVDNQEAESSLTGNCMLAVPLTAGTHTVSFRYINSAFYTGLAVSFACLILFLIMICHSVKNQALCRTFEIGRKSSF